LWLLPLTCGYTRGPERLWHRVYRSIEDTPLARLHIIGILERLGIVARTWLNFEAVPEQRLTEMLEVLRSRRPSHIILTVHSSSLVAGDTPYTRTIADEERLFGTIDRVLAAVGRCAEFEPATIAGIASALEAGHT
jgi:hypothetical protein